MLSFAERAQGRAKTSRALYAVGISRCVEIYVRFVGKYRSPYGGGPIFCSNAIGRAPGPDFFRCGRDRPLSESESPYRDSYPAAGGIVSCCSHPLWGRLESRGASAIPRQGRWGVARAPSSFAFEFAFGSSSSTSAFASRSLRLAFILAQEARTHARVMYKFLVAFVAGRKTVPQTIDRKRLFELRK